MKALNTGGLAFLVMAASFICMLATSNPVWAEGDDAAMFDSSCYQCHSKKEITPWIAQTWSKSLHAKSGIDCHDCHGSHDDGFETEEFNALPGPDTCGKCHPIKVKETMASAHAGVTKCSSCHPRHTFSLKVAQNPMICSTCHSGTPHVDGYRNSKMGVIFMTEGPGSSATCQSCHMPDGIHNVSRTLKDKGEMLKVCNNCHSASFAGEVLSSGRFSMHW